MHHWSSVITEDLWPYTVWHEVTFYNASIWKHSKHYPHYLFTGEDPPSPLADFRVSGAPTYVFHKKDL